MQKIFASILSFLLAIGSLHAQTTQVGEWKSGDYTTMYAEKNWDFSAGIAGTISGAGQYSIIFTYTSGEHKYLMTNAVIKADGLVVASVSAGRTINEVGKSITYTFYLKSVPKTLTMRANVKTEEGINSNGIIELQSNMVPVGSGGTTLGNDVLENGVLTIAEGTTSLKSSAYKDRNDIVKVVCPPSLETINAYAFRNCTNLKIVELSNVATLMGYVFDGCISLDTIYVSENLTKIGDRCIPARTEMVYPEGSWAQEWYESQYFLTVNTPNIPANAYANKNFKKIIIGDGVETIGNNAFANMPYLTELTMGKNVRTIGNSAFSGSLELKSITLPTTLESIGDNCFALTKISEISLPESLTLIGANAFKESEISAISFGSSISVIPESVCDQCPLLKTVEIKGAEKITANAFKDCPQLELVSLNEGLTYIGSAAFKDCPKLESVSLPSTVQNIMGQAFANTSISQCDIPQSVANISANSFSQGVVPHDVTDGIELKPIDIGLEFPTYPLANDKYVVKSMDARVINLERITTITAKNGDIDYAYERINFPVWDRDYQCILDILGGGADTYELVTNSTGERYIRASVGHLSKGESRTIVVRFKILRTPTEYTQYLSDEPTENYDEFVAHYLKPSNEIGGLVSDHPTFQAIAAEHKAETTSPVGLARLAYLYPWQHISFKSPEEGTIGPLKALEYGYGDCTEFAGLFITICRASGIPCRHVAVATYSGNEPLEFNGHNHSVAEVYLEPVGWFAVDANLGGGSLTGKHRFGHVTTVQIYMRPEGRTFESYSPVVYPYNMHQYTTTWRATEADCGEVQTICTNNTRLDNSELAENKPVNGLPEAVSYTEEQAIRNIIETDNAPGPEAYGIAVNDTIVDSVLTIGYRSKTIKASAYAGRTDFRKVIVPEGVTTISAYAFRNNPNLKEVVLPTSCTEINVYAFQNSPKLEKINLSNVTVLADYVFNNCPNLDSVTLSENVTHIGKNCFPTNTVIKCIAGSYAYDYIRKNGCEFEIVGYTDEWAEMLKTDDNLIANTRRTYFTFDNEGHQCECYTTRPLEETAVQEHITRLVINCHGAPPDPERFCNQAIKHLGKECDNAVIIAPALFNKPYFPADSPDKAVWFNIDQYLGGLGAWTKTGERVEITAYEVLDEMIRSVLKSANYPNIKEVWVMGLSAGGTTIAHYSIVNVVQNEFPDIKFKYVAKCIPDYVYLSDEREEEIDSEVLSVYDKYPNGLSDIGNTNYYPGRVGLTAEQIVEQFRTRKALFVTGSLDDALVEDKYAHGDNWVVRNENYRIHLNKVYGKTNRTQFTYIIQGLGHVELGLTDLVQTFLWTDSIPQPLIDEMNYEPVALEDDFIADSIVFPATVTPTAEQLSEREKQAENYIITPSATYSMGDTRGQGGKSELPVHSETVKSFYIRKYLITQQEYSDVMSKNKTYSDTEGQKPMMLSWYDACDFCNKLSEKEGFTPCYYIDKNELDPTNRKRYAGQSWLVVLNPDADGYRLPFEAEWEFAARAGTDYLYPGTNGEGPGEGKNGTGVDFYAFYWKNSGDVYLEGLESQWNWNIIGPNNPGTKPVGLKKPNTWGLYDMAGNAKEWCYDWYADNYDKPNETGYYKVLRGGDYRGYRADLRISARGANQPAKTGAVRLVRSNISGAKPTVSLTETSVTEQFTNLNIYTHGRTIVVENAQDEIRVYDVMGRLVCRDAIHRVHTRITVNDSGVYIVKIGNLAKKIRID